MEKYALIITEKPDAAQKIASALDVHGKPEKMATNGMPYYIAKRGKEIVVVPALGHLYTVAEEKKGRSNYPIFNFNWVPRYKVEKNAKHTRRWLEAISKLAKEADVFIDACDYDIEGSIIGYFLLKYACGGKENSAKRMKYSTLTKEELEKSYSKMSPHLDFSLIEAGRTRHEVDWLYGINLSRALTTAVKNWSGRYATLSTGRVQGPTLKFLAAREKAIGCFVPTPYWSIKAEIYIANSIFEAEYEKKTVETKKEADTIINSCNGKNGRIEKINVKKFQQTPPTPFDLGALQGEAYSLFGYTPMQTLKIAQRLYLDALISYPRTSSQKLPTTIGYATILKNLVKVPEYKKLASELLAKKELRPNEGKKKDPAHPAIYPTGNLPENALENAERKIWDIIVRRFMAVFGDPAIKQSTRVCINIENYRFYLSGRQILEEGWRNFYEPYLRLKEALLPPLREEQEISVKKVISEDKFTKPSMRYNAGSLLKKMEKEEIGTKATRAAIIQTLHNRKYCRDKVMILTDLGLEVHEVLEKHCPTITSVKLTKELEDKMIKVQMNSEKRENVLLNAIEVLKPIIENLKRKEMVIGEQLSNATSKAELEERKLGMCPICKTGELTILYSRKTGKRFGGCTNYFKGLCKTSFPLPQKGAVKPLGKNCGECGWPIVFVGIKGRRSWILCVNPMCPSKQKRRDRIAMQNMQ